MTGPVTEKYHRRKDAARFVREKYATPTSAQQLAKLAVIGGGPPFHKFSRFPIYKESDLVAWAEKMLGEAHSSTSEFGPKS